MWPLYDPSVYQPPSPTKRQTATQFAATVAELEHKPDVDSVDEVLSNLRGQESLRPSGIPFRRFILHPFMLLPAGLFLLTIALGLYDHVQQAGDPNAHRLAAPANLFWLQAGNILRGGPLFVVLPVLVVILIGLRASMRDKDPEVLAMRSTAAASVARMALNPKYIHEPFSSTDRAYLRRLLKGRSRDADAALVVLMSEESTASEPDPEFGGRPNRRSDFE
jgi:hypothetical protein